MAEPLWTLQELVNVTGGQILGTSGEAFHGISIDSRTTEPGDIFVAILGEHHDGHDFAADALKAGAGIAIVSRHDEAMAAAGPLLLVDDPLRALERLGIAARNRSSARIVAVTGSVGKTGTKEALRLCLQTAGKTHASVASFNNHWGVPVSLARMPRDARFAIFELGMNHAGEIETLVAMVRPHVAIITTIAPVHIGYLGSIEAIADAKAEIFSGLEPGGAAVINADIDQHDRLAEVARRAGASRIVSFGEKGGADARLLNVSVKDDCSVVEARILGQDITYCVGAPGHHIATNSLAVLAAATLAGADLAVSALALRDMRAPKGRGARQRLLANGGEVTLIDESYNANPVSMRAALALLGQAKPGRGGRRIAVMGDMLELGDEADRFHAELSEAVEAAQVDRVFLCGRHMEALWHRLRPELRGGYASDSEKLVAELLDDVHAGDVVMVKGSLGSRMAVLVDALRRRFTPASADAA